MSENKEVKSQDDILVKLLSDIRDSIRELRSDIANTVKEIRERGTSPPHRHKIVIDGTKARCKDGNCDFEVDVDGNYMRIEKFDDVLRLLKVPHTDHEYRFLDCPNCRDKFLKTLEDLGYKVYSRGKEIRIRL